MLKLSPILPGDWCPHDVRAGDLLQPGRHHQDLEPHHRPGHQGDPHQAPHPGRQREGFRGKTEAAHLYPKVIWGEV